MIMAFNFKNELLLIVIVIAIATAQKAFEIPNVKIEGLRPTGLRASIPDVPGIRLVAYHFNINDPLSSSEPGQYSRDITKATNGRWVFEDLDVALVVGDAVYYWMFVQFESLGYRKEDANATIKALVPVSGADRTPNPTRATNPTRKPTQPPVVTDSPCNPSVTRVNGIPQCQQQLIFEDTFNSLDTSKWQQECRLAVDEGGENSMPLDHGEFVSYQTKPENSFISNGKLVIVPTLLDSNTDSEYIETGSLDLTKSCGCTSEKFLDAVCIKTASNAGILPPVVSAKFKTRNFSFKYGRIQIRAKMPTGDWIYPELYLQPKDHFYGANYRSGLMRIAFTRGNVMLTSGSKQIDGRELSGGLLLTQFGVARNFSSRTYIGNTQWTNEYHDYELIWAPDKVTLKVDGTPYGTISAPIQGFQALKDSPYFLSYASTWVGEKMAPFDKEMLISLGLGVGGVTDFPDQCITKDAGGNDHVKPWQNRSPKAMFQFWDDIENWKASWSTDDNQSGLQIDHVRVWAL